MVHKEFYEDLGFRVIDGGGWWEMSDADVVSTVVTVLTVVRYVSNTKYNQTLVQANYHLPKNNCHLKPSEKVTCDIYGYILKRQDCKY